jgi:RNA polymerase sigma-B factor
MPDDHAPQSAIRANDDLLAEHGWIAERCAARFAGRGEPLDDLRQVASLALVKAAGRFDPSRGDFAPYAVATVLGELRRHFRDHTWRMSVSRRAKDLGTAVQAAIESLSQQHGRSPRPDEVADHLDLPIDVVLEALEARLAYRPDDLDTADIGADRLGAADPHLETADDRILLQSAAQALDPRRRQVVFWRFYDGCTQAEIADRLGVSQVQVSRLLSSALAELRNQLSQQRPTPS